MAKLNRLNRLNRLELCKAILKCDTDEVKRILKNPQQVYMRMKDSKKTKQQKAFMVIQIQQLANQLLKDDNSSKEQE